VIAPDELLSRWTADEELLREYGANEAADAVRHCRHDLDAWWRERLLDKLTIAEAADYSGHAYDTIQRKLASGEIQNVGRKGSPKVRRCDLPCKPPGQHRVIEAGDLTDRIQAAR
jgi:hypothetical protein